MAARDRRAQEQRKTRHVEAHALLIEEATFIAP
jgi:hypothetical protein